jgi:hypothetical protein
MATGSRRVVVAVLVCAAVVVVWQLLASGGTERLCENIVLESRTSPDSVRVAVVYHRRCGATSSTSSQVSILTGVNPTPSGRGNALIMRWDAPLRVVWTSRDTVTVHGRESDPIVTHNVEVAGVTVVLEMD